MINDEGDNADDTSTYHQLHVLWQCFVLSSFTCSFCLTM